MYYNEITEEMWDKIESKGIVVLMDGSEYVNFVVNYNFNAADEWFPHIGDEVDSDLISRSLMGEGWGKSWSVVTRPARQSASKDPVVEWLDKYYYVTCVDKTVGKIGSGFNEAYLETDHGDMLGSVEIMEFINNRYELLQKEAKSSKQKELAEKKAKLLEELDAIDKELEGL